MAEQGILKKLKPFDRAQEFEFVRPAAMNIEYEDFELEISSSPFQFGVPREGCRLSRRSVPFAALCRFGFA